LTSDNTEQYKLQKLEDMHLYSQNIGGIEIKGNLEELYIYFIVAIVILLISCINFINITISSSSTRLKEIALRKTLGADRKQLIYQFCGESLLIVSISVVFSMALTTLLLPVYNSVWGIKVTGNIFLRADVIIAVISLNIIISVISGAYISFYVSRMSPAKIFGGAVSVGVKSSFVRYALVLVQFTVALVMIIYVEIIHSQYLHIKNKDLGFNAASLLQIELSKYANKDKYELFQNIAKENPLIENVSGASVIFPKKNITSDLSDNKERSDKQITNENFWFVDPNFIDVLKLRLNKGRNFTSEITSKMNDEVILNKKAANVLGWANPVGKTIYNEVTNKNYIIIGIVDNFHFENLKMDVKPVVLAINKGLLTNIIIRVRQKNTSQAIKYLNGIWNNIFPEQPFNYNIVTDKFKQMNNSLNNLFYLFSYFSVIAIVIAFLGIIGLSSFSIEKRKKEIAIRKVLGANPFEIIKVVSKECIIMSIVSNLIGWPVAYYIIEKWLGSYASRIDVKLEYFIIPSIMIILITFLTVAFQILKTISKNPADSLNTE
ncbi:MAG: FtsX-like permease family protein, partial [Bacteroidota bacterium]|nr:FtsX-like permease family protein [Bacteroidota bacterium]